MHSGGGSVGGMPQQGHRGHFLRAGHQPTISHHQQQRLLVRVEKVAFWRKERYGHRGQHKEKLHVCFILF